MPLPLPRKSTSDVRAVLGRAEALCPFCCPAGAQENLQPCRPLPEGLRKVVLRRATRLTQTGPVLGAATAQQHLSRRYVPDHGPCSRGALRKEAY